MALYEMNDIWIRNAKVVGSTPITGTRYSKARSDASLVSFRPGVTPGLRFGYSHRLVNPLQVVEMNQ